MKIIITAILAASLLSGTAIAQPGGRGGYQQDRNDGNRGGPGDYPQDRYDHYRGDPGVRMGEPRYSRGDHVPNQFAHDRQYAVDDWQQHNLRKPPRGYHWVRDENNNYFLAAITTGIILDLLLNGGR